MVTFGEKWHDECHKQEGNLFQGQPLPQQTAYEESFQVLNVYLHAMESIYRFMDRATEFHFIIIREGGGLTIHFQEKFRS